MTPDQHSLAIKYLMQRLPPEDQEELKTLLGENIPDIAEDAIKGKIAMDRLSPRLQRQMAARLAPDRTAADAAFYERFPHARRLK